MLADAINIGLDGLLWFVAIVVGVSLLCAALVVLVRRLLFQDADVTGSDKPSESLKESENDHG